MLTNKTTRARRKLNLTPQTVAVITSTDGIEGHLAPLSTHQTNQASCNKERQLDVPAPATPNQPRPNPGSPIRRP